MKIVLILALSFYLLFIFMTTFYAKLRVKTEKDFLIAGRRLSFPLAVSTIFTTWFGAGTLLTATDEIRNEGLMASALEPYGAGFCLIIGGLFFTKPLWNMKLLTIADFFRNKFGQKAEMMAVFLSCPGFVLWIAVQLMASSQVLNLMLGLPPNIGVLIIGGLAILYTCIGGMWSIAYLDTLQIILILLGLFATFIEVISYWGGGFFSLGLANLWHSLPIFTEQTFSMDTIFSTVSYLNVFFIAALGNLPSQDFAQRVFSAKSAHIAKRATIFAGLLYIVIGSIPVALALASRTVLKDDTKDMIVLALTQKFAHPFFVVLLVLSILAAIFSTLDSSILAASSPLSHNFLRRHISHKISSLNISRMTVLLIGCISILFAYGGDRMYPLLEAAYSSTLVVFFAPLVIGIFSKKHCGRAAVFSMTIGALLWFIDAIFFSFSFSMSLIYSLINFISYFLFIFCSNKLKKQNNISF